MIRMVLAALLFVSAVVVWPTDAAAQDSSAVTVSGKGDFAGLEITVAQTRDLINQTVRVSWTGGEETGPVGRFATNYLQIMQCWGDDPAGPAREQCQFGGLEAQSGLGLGNFTKSRQIAYNDPKDPREPTPIPATGAAFTEFHAVTGKKTPSYGEFFDAGTTNEVPFAKTRADGTGEIDFEAQTALEAYGLGCGTVVNNTPRHCWLVVVPRGDKEVNGRRVGVDHTGNNLDSSPLSQSNWENRIAVRLDFRPVGRACPIGVAERPLTGHEFVADAIARWQPALCANGGSVFGFTQVPDGIARDQLGLDEPGMVFTSEPLASPGKPTVYAPVAVSGYAIAFVLERQSRGPEVETDPKVWQRDGQLITSLNLTPRLVAKLLTQSYRDAVPGNQPYLRRNPRRLNEDPDFLAINEEFKVYGALMNALDILAPSADLDATKALWTWINGDTDARAFLDGSPDPFGMVVNQNYRNLALPLPNYPKADLSCKELAFPLGPDCALLSRPLSADLHEGGRAISRGDTLGKLPNGLPDPLDPSKPGYSRSPRQPTGERSLLAVVDTATAQRYGLPAASLRNAAGQFVAPTPEALGAALDQLSPTEVAGVKIANPAGRNVRAYPLPNVTYAAAVPSAMDKAAGAEYAKFLRFASGPGQTLGEADGQLPRGYLPLPDSLRRQAGEAAAVIERDAGIPITTPNDPPPATENVVNNPAPTTNAPANPPQPPAVPPAKPSETPTPKPVAALRDTPSMPVSWLLRHLLAVALIAGGLATVAGPLMSRLSSRVRRGPEEVSQPGP
ncbi:hypothetical protein SK803_17160 [Lentzea sp. BCCO 10_0856]|uniref:PBP domain-containing protein n=1 Tax=Lentzea miocenica TaxID=3095431 RepID=A0ABU4T1B7_9PSEU|nr:hypothetical protein [Lentzea sp. BCCO 10_0856]MDX8031957.1 hypothetical protein [Lentzea sp. BCCO 10_0856]